MSVEVSKKLKSSKKTTKPNLNKSQNAKLVEKNLNKNLDKVNHLDILDQDTWDYMNNTEDLRYEY